MGLRQENARIEAKQLLKHYFRLVRGNVDWHPDLDAEIEMIVDLIIEAAQTDRKE